MPDDTIFICPSCKRADTLDVVYQSCERIVSPTIGDYGLTWRDTKNRLKQMVGYKCWYCEHSISEERVLKCLYSKVSDRHKPNEEINPTKKEQDNE